MTKVMYNGNEIELADELEYGYKELDMLIKEKRTVDRLEENIELNNINLDNVFELKLNNLQSANKNDLGDVNE